MPNIASPDFPPLVNRENEACDEPTIGQPGKPPRNAKWAPQDDVTLVESLKAFADGNSADNGTFKSASFTAAVKSLKDSHKLSGGAPKTAKSCSRRCAILKANCLVTKKIVIAGDKVWDDYLKAHPEAKIWCSTPFPLYDDIIVLIDGCHATGEGALHIHQLSSKESSPAWPETLLSDDEDDPPTHETCKSTEVSKSDRERAASVSPMSARPLKKHSNMKLTGPVAILGVADALESVATSFNTPNLLDDVPSTPKRCISAIWTVCADPSLSSEECAKVVALFTRDIAIADAYTAISDAPLHKMYICLELDKM
ncbi:hypothetical protein BDR04DRAFT_1133235 [Suillus decipiens]|nr:hypothetical protein BDR04DRAFT_1133235 [Suillus decipiens]